MEPAGNDIAEVAQPFTVHIGSGQHPGTRKSQEDFIGHSSPLDRRFAAHCGTIAVIADGLGGYSNGDVASRTAVNAFLEAYSQKTENEPIREALLRSLFAANDAVLAHPLAKAGEAKIGTTLVAAVVHAGYLYWVSVGDSRLYLARQRRLIQLTADHIFAIELDRHAQMNDISESDALSHPERDILTSYVGRDDLSLLDCNMRPFELEDGDRLLLCTDGLYRTMDPEEIFPMLDEPAFDVAPQIIRKTIAKDRPEQDNSSLVLISIERRLPPEVTAEHELRRLSSISRSIGGLFLVLSLFGIYLCLGHSSSASMTEPSPGNISQPPKDDLAGQKAKPHVKGTVRPQR